MTQELSYDPWGRLRDPNTQVAYTPNTEPVLFLSRGYTGHEHLTVFGLINMNARLYDPALGRFLSPDPYVQAPDFSQSFNRYSYCVNNPLVYTDRNGKFFWFAVAAVVGGTVNWIAHGAQFNMKGLAAFGIGAAAAVIGMATGGSAFLAAGGGAAGAGGFLAGAFASGIGYAYGSMTQSIGNSIAFNDPMPTVGDFVKGLGFSMLTGGTINGVTALVNGRSFLTGNLFVPKPITIAPIPIEGTQPELNLGAKPLDTQDMRMPGSNDLPANIDYPPNNGALGTSETKYLYKGEVVDRFGGTSEYSKYLSPEGTPIPSRSLPPSTNFQFRDVYQVAKPFPVQASTIAPYYGMPGMGTQYLTPLPIQNMVNKGILIRITIPIP